MTYVRHHGVDVLDTALDLGDGADVPMNVRNTGGRNFWICVCCKRLLEQKVSDSHHSSDRTHADDPKDPVKIQSPGGDLFRVVLCIQISRNHVSFFLLDDIPFDLCHNPGFR